MEMEPSDDAGIPFCGDSGIEVPAWMQAVEGVPGGGDDEEDGIEWEEGFPDFSTNPVYVVSCCGVQSEEGSSFAFTVKREAEQDLITSHADRFVTLIDPISLNLRALLSALTDVESVYPAAYGDGPLRFENNNQAAVRMARNAVNLVGGIHASWSYHRRFCSKILEQWRRLGDNYSLDIVYRDVDLTSSSAQYLAHYVLAFPHTHKQLVAAIAAEPWSDVFSVTVLLLGRRYLGIGYLCGMLDRLEASHPEVYNELQVGLNDIFGHVRSLLGEINMFYSHKQRVVMECGDCHSAHHDTICIRCLLVLVP